MFPPLVEFKAHGSRWKRVQVVDANSDHMRMAASLQVLECLLLLLCVHSSSASWWHFKSRPWGDAHKRHTFRKGMLKDADQC
eukprot:2971346-Amphidinium_carterae.1